MPAVSSRTEAFAILWFMQHQVGMIRALNPMRLFGNPGQLAPAARSHYRSGSLTPARSAHASHHERRDENPPSPGTWLMIFGATAVVGGLGAWWITKGKKSSTPPVVGPGRLPGTGGGGGGSGSTGGGYVGKPGYNNWPHKGMFENESDFLFTLAQLEYEVGDWEKPICPQVGGKMAVCNAQCTSVICGTPFAAVKQFQSDWRLFRQNMADTSGAGVPASTSVDGLLGPGTINALYFVKTMFIDSDTWGNWKDAIDQLRADASLS